MLTIDSMNAPPGSLRGSPEALRARIREKYGKVESVHILPPRSRKDPQTHKF